jgi:hypothetical protein
MREPFFRGRAGGGQLLLMRATAPGRNPEKRPSPDPTAKDDERDADDSP